MKTPVRIAATTAAAIACALAAAAACGAPAAPEAAASASTPAASAAPAALPASASAPAPTRVHDRTHADAISHCESAVGDAIREMRGKAVQDVQFGAESRVVDADGDRIGLKGAGRYRRAPAGTVDFRYSCAFDESTGATSGVLFHDSEAAAAGAARPAWQPDLDRISPEACETAVASSLKASHPRVEGIVFDSGSRKLEPGADDRTALVGSGHLQRAAGMHPDTFHYRCEFDAASGRVVDVQAND